MTFPTAEDVKVLKSGLEWLLDQVNDGEEVDRAREILLDDKLQQIIQDHEIVQRLKEINILDYIVSNHEIDDYSVNEVATLEKWNEFLKSILENKK